MNKKRLKYVLILIYSVTTIYIIGLYVYNTYTEAKIPYGADRLIAKIEAGVAEEAALSSHEDIDPNTIVITEHKEEEKPEEQPQVYEQQDIKQEKIDEKFSGYNVIAELKIPKINLITDVLEQYSKEALLVSVTKFWGSSPNEIGNFCISGHNYVNKNMFNKLKRLEIGDNLLLTDKNQNTIEYKIYDIFKVEPSDTSVVSQKTDGKREVTLITCTSDSKQRIIVKALEVKK